MVILKKGNIEYIIIILLIKFIPMLKIEMRQNINISLKTAKVWL